MVDLDLFSQTSLQNNVWNLFRVNSKDTRMMSMTSFMWTSNRFHTFFWCFQSWLWTSTCQMGLHIKIITVHSLLSEKLVTKKHCNSTSCENVKIRSSWNPTTWRECCELSYKTILNITESIRQTTVNSGTRRGTWLNTDT